MYAAKLKKNPEYSNLIRTINQVNKFRDIQLVHLEHVKKELELRKAKGNSILLRKKLMEHQNKLNYSNELDRVRGYLSQNDSRFPIGTTERLKKRKDQLEKLGAQIIDINN